MNAEWKRRYEFAIQAAQQAGQIALRYFPDTTAGEFAKFIELKNDDSPVTLADRETEAHLRHALLGQFPHDGFVGEESGEYPSQNGYRWIVDPIDGTRSFVRGIPLWATLVGLEYDRKLIAGVVVEPVLNNTYRALRGDGAFKNNRSIRVSAVDKLEQAIVSTSDINFFEKAEKIDIYMRLARRVQRQRGYGDYFGFTLLAQGSVDVMLDFGVHFWDIAALVPLIDEAGGRLTDWTGQRSGDQSDALATNGLLHQMVVDVITNRN